jgi:hypothetical protein
VAVGLFGGMEPSGPGRPERRDLRGWGAISTWAGKVLDRAEATVYA